MTQTMFWLLVLTLCVPVSIQCPVGTADSTTCQPCTTCKYSQITGKSACTLCTPGKYSTTLAATSESTCQWCPDGGWSSAGSSSVDSCYCNPEQVNAGKGYSGNAAMCRTYAAGGFLQYSCSYDNMLFLFLQEQIKGIIITKCCFSCAEECGNSPCFCTTCATGKYLAVRLDEWTKK
jgi:hypothetical protein